MPEPIDFLLKCFNALAPSVATDPSKILDGLTNHRRAPLTVADTNSSTAAGGFSKAYSNNETAQSAYASIAASFGLSGSYGPYSGSCKVSSESEEESSSKAVHGNLTAHIDYGTLTFAQPVPATIAAHLKDEMMQSLNSITSLAEAELFTKNYGTHVVLGVSLGGYLAIVVEATASSLDKKEKLAAEVEVAYDSIVSMDAAAQAAKEVKSSQNASSVRQEVKVLGGNPSTAAGISLDAKESIDAWAATCSAATVCGLLNSVELYTLAEPAPGNILKKYLDWCLLKHSLENPVIFSNDIAIAQTHYNSVSATAAEGYKIISGGAWLDKDGPDFLTSSFPELSGSAINSWKAVSHDAMIGSREGAVLVAYAIGVYDPTDLLQLSCVSAAGAAPTIGADRATRMLDNAYTLTGGGCETSSTQQNPRYLTGCYPATQDGAYRGWTAEGHDYAYSSTASLNAWAVGIALRDTTGATLANQVLKAEGGLQSHGESFAALGNERKIAGGGVQLSESSQNLVHASFPVSRKGQVGWQEFNGDLNGVFDKVVATSYAITLRLNSKTADVTFQPYWSKAELDAQARARAEAA